MKMPDETAFRVFGGDYRGACPTEDMEQITFFNTLRRLYPATHGALALHPRNEGLKTGGQFAAVQKHRAEGMTKGAADIIIPGAPAFVCELKRKDPRKSQWQDGQEAYLTAAASTGCFACVAFGWEAAWEALEAWLAL
jgi:hypothetical protein